VLQLPISREQSNNFGLISRAQGHHCYHLYCADYNADSNGLRNFVWLATSNQIADARGHCILRANPNHVENRSTSEKNTIGAHHHTWIRQQASKQRHQFLCPPLDNCGEGVWHSLP